MMFFKNRAESCGAEMWGFVEKNQVLGGGSFREVTARSLGSHIFFE
jgi:hypothetical protein